MKRLFSISILCILLISSFMQIYANPSQSTYSIDSILISSDGTSVSVNCTVPENSQNVYYLFSTLSETENINNLTPISDGVQTNGKLTFTIKYDSKDHSSALYGYCLGASNGKNGYVQLTDTHYINNLSDSSHNNSPFPVLNTKKGLEIQYITDAQLLGIGHTVVHVYLNDLISEESDDAYAYIYGDLKYYLNNDALTLLDYRIKTLTEAGVNVYINFLLAFDSDAKNELYYPNSQGDSDTLFAPNISSADTLNQYAAAIHHVAERYTTGDNGFCGSYIIGYEVNNEKEKNSAGISSLSEYAREYGRLLRVSYLALTSAYSDAKLFVSVSNHWNIPIADSKAESFGAKEFLDELFSNYSDIPFGIAINPYPSSLIQTDFWNDPKATFSIDTEYITMKNIGILTDYINSYDNDLYSSTRKVVISEFGVSGVKGEESEMVQAAAYAYAYYIADNNPFIESFIWHRHVDHRSEIDLNYGIYSSTNITLEAKEKKFIHDVITSVDNTSVNSVSTIKSLIQYLPVESYENLIKQSSPSRTILTISPISTNYNPTAYKKQTLFDFSKNLYSFYPTDNTEYICMANEDNYSFMRIATHMISTTEYMGAGALVALKDKISEAEYLTIKLRVNSTLENTTFALVLSDNKGFDQMSILTSTVTNNEWVTLTFPIDELLSDENTDISSIKLWVKSENSENEQIYLDISNIQLLYKINNTPYIILTIIICAAIVCTITSIIIMLINRYKERK